MNHPLTSSVEGLLKRLSTHLVKVQSKSVEKDAKHGKLGRREGFCRRWRVYWQRAALIFAELIMLEARISMHDTTSQENVKKP